MTESIRLLGKAEVTQRLGICERTLEKLERAQQFPPSLRLGKRVLWAESVVEQWLVQALEAQMKWTPPQRGRRQPPRG